MMMNTNDETPENLEELHFVELVMRYQDDALTDSELDELVGLLRQDPAKLKAFRNIQLRTTALRDALRLNAFTGASGLLDNDRQYNDRQWTSDETTVTSPHRFASPLSFRQLFRSRRSLASICSAGLGIALLVAGRSFWNRDFQESGSRPQVTADVSKNDVLLVGECRAMYFGSPPLLAGEVVPPHRDFMLQSGMVELKFPTGAVAIVEGPAIFRVDSAEKLALSTGSCSVYAPPGAEGFEVLTPTTKLVDRGTRFFVNVAEDSETEVHVIEGAADLYPQAGPARVANPRNGTTPTQLETKTDPVHLTLGEAMRVGGLDDLNGRLTEFQDEGYKAQLPDRLVNYAATSISAGSIDDLVSVTVQRNGKNHVYSVEELIPIEVTWYRGDPEPDVNGSMCGPVEKPSRPESLLEDWNLASGLINFGGQAELLTERPVVNSDPDDLSAGSAGLGIRFRKPVINQPGPDVVFFEIQCFNQLPEGDPFHVYPLSGRPELKPITVKKYDLTMESVQAQTVAPLWSHRYKIPFASLSELAKADASLIVDVAHLHFRVVAVGIDLSDMNYADGEAAEELFFQHASPDGKAKVDPVLIAGLPPLTP